MNPSFVSAARLVVRSLALLSACGGDAGGNTDTGPDTLFAPGDWGVGYAITQLTYDRAVTGEPRTVPVHVWYPAPADGDEPPVEYPVALFGSFESTIAREGADMADGGTFPVVVYSHGGGAEPNHAYPYAEVLASHGFVVVSPGHVGTLITDTVDALDPATRWIVDRPADVSATLDWLAAPTGDISSMLQDRTETDEVVVIGYSLGGLTSYLLAGARVDVEGLGMMCDGCAELSDPDFMAAYAAGARDPRVVAHVAQAPEVLPFLTASSLATPGVSVMLQSGRLDITNPTVDGTGPAWDNGAGAEDLWLDMPTGAHLTFIPVCLTEFTTNLTVIGRPSAVDDGCAPRFQPVGAALEALAGYAHGFARIHLLGETEWQDVLAGPALRDLLEVTSRP